MCDCPLTRKATPAERVCSFLRGAARDVFCVSAAAQGSSEIIWRRRPGLTSSVTAAGTPPRLPCIRTRGQATAGQRGTQGAQRSGPGDGGPLRGPKDQGRGFAKASPGASETGSKTSKEAPGVGRPHTCEKESTSPSSHLTEHD